LAASEGNSCALGWLQCANGAGEPNGEGAVAVRGGKGLLLTADPGLEAAGSQLARAGSVGLADTLNEIACVGEMAEQHYRDETTALAKSAPSE
jgi:type VI secretion system secreted protein VgrG